MSLMQLTIYKNEVCCETEIIKTFNNASYDELVHEIMDLLTYDISFSVDYINEVQNEKN